MRHPGRDPSWPPISGRQQRRKHKLQVREVRKVRDRFQMEADSRMNCPYLHEGRPKLNEQSGQLPGQKIFQLWFLNNA